MMTEKAKTAVRICIADDHPIVRAGLRRAFQDVKALSIVAEASDGREVLAALETHPIDLLLLDISMPLSPGVDLLKTIKTRWPLLPVLMLTVHPASEFAARAFALGASGYITKDSPTVDLLQAIRTVLSGQRYVATSYAQELAAQMQAAHQGSPHDALSGRELEVLCLIATGKPLTAIADHLKLSVKTISTYRTRILDKLGMTNNAELVRYALRHHLTEA